MPFSRESYRCDVNQVPAWVVGLALAAGVGLLAHRARALSASGAVAAALVGTLAMAAGWAWGVLVIAYFTTSSLLSRFRAAEKHARMEARVEKQGPRDAFQVLANGGVYALMALQYSSHPDVIWQVLGAGALAASAADTWATEIGALAKAPPRSILSLKPVAVGTSGGVTIQGLLAALAGGGFVALVAWLVGWPIATSVAALLGGIFGCLLDSVLGASLQARYWCAVCGAVTERRRHHCGTSTTRVGGLAWLNNDGVNAIATVGGAVAGAVSTAFL